MIFGSESVAGKKNFRKRKKLKLIDKKNNFERKLFAVTTVEQRKATPPGRDKCCETKVF
jgi:hypothetical protein